MTFEQFAQAALAMQAEHLAETKEQTRILKRLATALAVNPERPAQRRQQAQAEQHAAAGSFAASQARRKLQRKVG